MTHCEALNKGPLECDDSSSLSFKVIWFWEGDAFDSSTSPEIETKSWLFSLTPA